MSKYGRKNKRISIIPCKKISVFPEACDITLAELEKRKGAELRRIIAFSPCLVRGKKK